MMQQYLAPQGTAIPDTLLFYRMGDFYELFFDDARKANAPAGHHADHARPGRPASPVVMAGVPVHSLDTLPR